MLFFPFQASGRDDGAAKRAWPRFTFGIESSYVLTFMNRSHFNFISADGGRRDVKSFSAGLWSNGQFLVHGGVNLTEKVNISLYTGYGGIFVRERMVPVSVRVSWFYGRDPMKNRVTVTIAGQEYTLVGSEDAAYTQKVAAHVDAKVNEVLEGAHVSLVDGAVLAAVNIADEYFKEVEAAENLRRQLKEYLEEATKMKLELSEAKREIFKLQTTK